MCNTVFLPTCEDYFTHVPFLSCLHSETSQLELVPPGFGFKAFSVVIDLRKAFEGKSLLL